MLKPVGERILVLEDEAETKTAGGIILPPTATQEKTQTGIVLEVGDDVTKIQKGQRILYDKYAGAKIKLDREYLVIKEDDILGILE